MRIYYAIRNLTFPIRLFFINLYCDIREKERPRVLTWDNCFEFKVDDIESGDAL